MNMIWKKLAGFAGAMALGGCSIVDNVEPRLYSANLETQNVMDQETLLNIVRASKSRPLNFVQITQISGSQTEDLKVGFPTITLGPAQAAAQRQFAFSGNILDSNAVGGFQANPLVSSAFQQGMMSPISPKIMAMLISEHGREPVFYAAIDSIEIVSSSNTNRTYTFHNDPKNDGGVDCAARRDASPVEGDVIENYLEGRGPDFCSYSNFIHFLKMGLRAGLTFELASPASSSPSPSTTGTTATLKAGDATASFSGPPPAPGGGTSPSSSTSSATTSSNLTGHLCFDPGLISGNAWEKYNESATGSSSECGRPAGSQSPAQPAAKSDQTSTTPTVDSSTLAFSFKSSSKKGAPCPGDGETPNYVCLTVTIHLRSPMGLYRYIGELANIDRAKGDEGIAFVTEENKTGEKFFHMVMDDEATKCAISADYEKHTYCIPQDEARTANVVGMLQDLRNLSITPTDLNSSFSVHVTP